MTDSHTLRLSASSWSLHRSLGAPGIYGPGADIPHESHGRGSISLLEAPALLAELGIRTMEICHFHLPSRAPAYLERLRDALAKNGVELWSLLVDAGDLTHEVHGQRDEAWIAGWLDDAQRLGAKRVRVIAGKGAPTAANLARSRAALLRLAGAAEARGLRLMTENWFDLLSTPAAVHALMDDLEGRISLCLDFGNWRGATKYEDLRAIAGYAESCHAKPQFDTHGAIEREDFARCIQITREAGFSGPYTLIYDGPNPDERAGLTALAAALAEAWAMVG